MPPLGDFLTPEERLLMQAQIDEHNAKERYLALQNAFRATLIQGLRLTPLDREFLKSIRVKAD